MRLDVLAPHQLQGQVPVPAQIPIHLHPVQQRPRLQPMPVIGALVEPLLQCPLVQVPDLIPGRQPRLFRPRQQVVHRAEADPATPPDLAVAHPEFVA